MSAYQHTARDRGGGDGSFLDPCGGGARGTAVRSNLMGMRDVQENTIAIMTRKNRSATSARTRAANRTEGLVCGISPHTSGVLVLFAPASMPHAFLTIRDTLIAISSDLLAFASAFIVSNFRVIAWCARQPVRDNLNLFCVTVTLLVNVAR